MMTRNNYVALIELNVNIDYKNVVIIWISLCFQMIMFSDEVKYFSWPCMKEYVLTFLILGFIFDYTLGPKKDKFFCAVFASRRGMSNAICYLVLHLQSEGLNILWIYPGTISSQYLKLAFAVQYSTQPLDGSQFIFLKYAGSIWDLGGKFRWKRRNWFWAFSNLITIEFLFKRGNSEEHP